MDAADRVAPAQMLPMHLPWGEEDALVADATIIIMNAQIDPSADAYYVLARARHKDT